MIKIIKKNIKKQLFFWLYHYDKKILIFRKKYRLNHITVILGKKTKNKKNHKQKKASVQ